MVPLSCHDYDKQVPQCRIKLDIVHKVHNPLFHFSFEIAARGPWSGAGAGGGTCLPCAILNFLLKVTLPPQQISAVCHQRYYCSKSVLLKNTLCANLWVGAPQPAKEKEKQQQLRGYHFKQISGRGGHVHPFHLLSLVCSKSVLQTWQKGCFGNIFGVENSVQQEELNMFFPYCFLIQNSTLPPPR